MAKLSKDQEDQLAELERLRDAPDDDRPGRGENLNFTIDLSNDTAVRRALKLGVLTRGDLDEFDEADPDDGDDPDGGDPDPDEQPRRRLTGADRMMGSGS
jgi:hypothetical protein